MSPFLTIVGNLRQAMSFFAAATDRGAVKEEPGLTLVSSGIDYGVFNSAILASPVWALKELEALLGAARAHYEGLGLPWSCWICEDLCDKRLRSPLKQLLLLYGLTESNCHPGMIAERLKPPRRLLPALEIRRVADAVTRRDFCQVTSLAFRLPLAVASRAYEAEPPWHGGLVGWVGYLEGAPVSTAAAIAAAGAVGVYSVSTVPLFERRGFAEAMLRHAVEERRRVSGFEQTVLQATQAGWSLYERLGYRQVTTFKVYLSAPPPALREHRHLLDNRRV